MSGYDRGYDRGGGYDRNSGYDRGGGGYDRQSGGGGGGGGGGSGRGGGRYSASRPDPRSGQPAPPVEPRLTLAEAVRELERIGATTRAGRYGKEGQAVDLLVNVYPTEISRVPDFIPHYDVTFEVVEDPASSTGGRGGRGGRGRGRGGRGRGGRAGRGGPGQEEKPLPVGIATKLMRDIEHRFALDFKYAKIAHDGKKNVYLSVTPDWKNNSFPAEWEGVKYMVHFNFANDVPMKDLIRFVNREEVQLPQEAVTLLDIVLRTNPMREFVYTGRGFALPPEGAAANMRLGDGCEAWISYYQSFKANETGMYLTFDVAYSAFYISQTVLDFAVDILRIRHGDDRPHFDGPLSSEQIKQLENAIRGLKVEQYHKPPSERKPLIVRRVSVRPANHLELETRDSRGKTVEEHFVDQGEPLDFPYLPCLDVQSGKNGHTFIPIEKARFCPAQRRQRPLLPEMKERMANIGARSPSARLQNIGKLLTDVNDLTQEYLNAFGVKVNMQRLSVPARILDPPVIQLGDHSVLDPKNNPNYEYHWSMKDHKFYQVCPPIKAWGVLVIASEISKFEVTRFVAAVRKVCTDAGMSIAEPRIAWSYTPMLFQGMQTLAQDINNDPAFGGQLCQLMMVIKENTATRDYNQIKNIAETYMGFPTQCVVKDNARSPKELYCLNLMLKINAKMNGVNSRIEGVNFAPLGKSFMVVGASVSHESALKAKGDHPSIAAMVGSIDKRCGRQNGVFRVQDAKVEGIANFGAMLFDLVNSFGQKEGFLPDNILIYRNGVADNQFAKLLSSELDDARSKIKELGYNFNQGEYTPKITFIVMQRGHHVRFEPASSTMRDLSGNCVPGTVVDSEVTHPINYDFYLISHNGIKGTSRPMRYTVLWDDLNLGPDEIQALTYRMCYTFARCTRSVSIVPPVYYADLLAVRGRAYLAARNAPRADVRPDQPQLGGSIHERGLPREISTSIPMVHGNLNRRMFYV